MHTTYTIERIRAFRLSPRHVGGILCGAGLGLLWFPSLIVTALGAELLAAAFWVWARATETPREQVARWAWLRRPAQALWLAAAIGILMPGLGDLGFGRGSAVELLRWLQAGAVVWAGLELLAALPLARPYSDLSGPLLAIRPWLPAILPAAGFMLLWRHQDQWNGIAYVRDTATALLLVTALLATLRAFGRLQWLVSLRWLLVSDSALAAVLVAQGIVHPEIAMLLWLAACGGRTFLLASELRSAAPRRGPFISMLWRAAGWTSSTALSWPILIAFGAGTPRLVMLAATLLPAVITTWVIVSRLEEARERRAMARPSSPLTLGHLMAALTLLLGPAALVTAWRHGLPAAPGLVLLALVPAAVSGAMATVVLRWRRQHAGITAEAPEVIVDPAQSPERVSAGSRLATLAAVSERLRAAARGVFRWITGLERRLVGGLQRLGTMLVSPIHDLHTGDAQEYLLLLAGLALLALTTPLLQ